MSKFFLLVLLFFFYSFMGWLMEVILGLFQHGRFINRGFLVGPVCPIYGCGALTIMLFLSRYKDDIIVLWCMSMFVCSVIEYLTSYVMEKIFKNRWWDYSDKKFNVNGRICLEFSFAFGLMAVVVLHFVNPELIDMLNGLSYEFMRDIACILLAIFIVDIIVSFNVIITIKNVSASLREDNTEAITKKVKAILMDRNPLYKRLIESFPMMKISNMRSILKDRLNSDKEKLKEEEMKYKKRLFK